MKIIPHSAHNIKVCDEGGGGNRISEDQIKIYLTETLGDAPQPKWGVPEGWGSYLAGKPALGASLLSLRGSYAQPSAIVSLTSTGR